MYYRPFLKSGVFLSLSIVLCGLFAQKPPTLHLGISQGEGGYQIKLGEKMLQEYITAPQYTLSQMMGNPKGNSKGILFDFGNPQFAGKVYYGFIPYGDSRHPMPVYFRLHSDILSGKAFINIQDNLSGKYDMVGWEKSGKGTLGYRVLDTAGAIVYDGIVTFEGTGPFTVVCTVTEGPFVNILSHNAATISFETNLKTRASVLINEQTFTEEKPDLHHEIRLTGLQPDTEYPYTVIYENNKLTFSLRTAPLPGTRKAFTFAYASDSRNGQGGGERDIYGTNAYIMKKIMALAHQQKIAFFQFSGDLINGYLTSPDETDLQYANWKRAIQPFAHYFPVYISMGNHEALVREFVGETQREYVSIDRWPYDTESAEAVFARNFVNPTNGPASEDGAVYDPNPKKTDFPSYEENVFYYTYDNVAVIVLNSDYWYSPSTATIDDVGGGLHGYIMDQQLKWLQETVSLLEKDENIDHVFITQHTPTFPNGGHVSDDMYYKGNNEYRPWVADKKLEKGILERRDEYLDILVNQSTKVAAIFTGDEHNYALTKVNPEMNMYPEDYAGKKLTLKRTIYQVNNGAAGAPYYAQEQTPWTPFVTGFTTQNALVLMFIEGKKIRMQVLNPDTLEEVDSLDMR
ncbi:MAG: metallophosphoesterase [Bacteroidia bacterium]|nr:metallophosphoesterase [Bacteroidia bacterium]